MSRSPVVYVELHGAQHAFDVFGSPRSRRMVRATERFLFAAREAHLHPVPAHAEPASAADADRAPSTEPSAPPAHAAPEPVSARPGPTGS